MLVLCEKKSWYRRLREWGDTKYYAYEFDPDNLSERDGYFELVSKSEYGALKFLFSAWKLDSGDGLLSGVLFNLDKNEGQYRLVNSSFFSARNCNRVTPCSKRKYSGQR